MLSSTPKSPKLSLLLGSDNNSEHISHLSHVYLPSYPPQSDYSNNTRQSVL
jgi:hypothetical protein